MICILPNQKKLLLGRFELAIFKDSFPTLYRNFAVISVDCIPRIMLFSCRQGNYFGNCGVMICILPNQMKLLLGILKVLSVDIVCLISVVMKRNLLYPTNIIVFVLLNLQTNRICLYPVTFV